ncbi:uncharacterized mitochondrial protein AtMg00810-like [Lactuca sativa]|uniref:uncharacterized mitochondrial protein AtMg00810-like n=1 Tax=Lactuca sativa TaxID=4236 RepID=UPI000CD8CAC1|nr:uncharacterized mitochondrial protein AtMg00810-like [Lactuca sativa]
MLSKALYGLRQAPRAWNSKLDGCLKQLGFKRCPYEYVVYIRKKNGKLLIVGVYVDDLIVTGDSDLEVEHFKEQMSKKFEMNDLGMLSYYLGFEVNQHDGAVTLKQVVYAKNIIVKTGMTDCNPCKYPMEPKLELTKDKEGEEVNITDYISVVGALRYLTHTRPDISYVVGLVSRIMERPTVQHMKVVKHILSYVKGTMDHGLVYTRGSKETIITGYTYSDHARDVNDGRSTGGMAYYLNENLVT